MLAGQERQQGGKAGKGGKAAGNGGGAVDRGREAAVISLRATLRNRM